MVKPVKHIPAGKFKATCLRLLDEVAADRQEYVVTKRGKPVARLVPLPEKPVKNVPPPELRGSVLRFDRPNDPIFEPMDEWPGDADP
ncbi:MAG: type II toxin-antitoxin system prevent-host-death family antitoxin [Planctomycetota bacterium]